MPTGRHNSSAVRSGWLHRSPGHRRDWALRNRSASFSSDADLICVAVLGGPAIASRAVSGAGGGREKRTLFFAFDARDQWFP